MATEEFEIEHLLNLSRKGWLMLGALADLGQNKTQQYMNLRETVQRIDIKLTQLKLKNLDIDGFIKENENV